MAKRQLTVQQQDAIDESNHADAIREVSFANTCFRIRDWADKAGTDYLNGKRPSTASFIWLVQLVKEFSTGTSETKKFTFTVSDISDVTGLEPGSLTARIKEWGEPVVKQAGRRKARYDLMKNLQKLESQFPAVQTDDWIAMIVSAGGL